VRIDAGTVIAPSVPQSFATANGVVAYDGLVIRLESSDAAALVWLREFLGPSFDAPGEGADASCTVALRLDEAHYRSLLRDAPPGVPMDAFSVDARVVRHPAWLGGSDGALLLHDPVTEVAFEVRESAFTVVGAPANLSTRTAFMRVVRELAMAHAGRAEGLLLHAAAFAVGERAVALAGPTAAGKTTLLLRALQSGRACYLANDRVRVSPSRRTVRGMPSIVTLRPRTRRSFPALGARLAAGGYAYRKSLAEHESRSFGPTEPWPDGRLGLNPAHFAHALGVERIGEATLAAIVFPLIAGAPGERGSRRLPPIDAERRLESCLLGAGPWRKQAEVFVVADARSLPDEAELRIRCRALARSVRCFEWRLDFSAGEDATDVDALLDLAC